MLAKLIKFSTALLFAPAIAVAFAQAQVGHNDEAAAILLFSGQDYQGDVREIFDPIVEMPALSFNDRARSVAVLAGTWEVCEHSNFTGRCIFLREDVYDLKIFRMNRNISSVRPVYEYTDAAHGLMFIRNRDGSIRYADQSFNGYDDYAYNDYAYGYPSSINLNIYHYGHSSDYRRHGYYHPRAGYGPYGFRYTRPGHSRVTHHYNYNRHNRYGHRRYNHRRYHRGDVRGHHGARNGAVTLYTDSRGRGASLGLNRGVRDLSRYRFNDNISSIDIREGRWEVCEHANYRGRCEIIDASTDRLNGLRLNDNISSIRPADGNTRRDRRRRNDANRPPRNNERDRARRTHENRNSGQVRAGRINDIGRPRRPRRDDVTNRENHPRPDRPVRPRRSDEVRADRRQQRQRRNVNTNSRRNELAGGRAERRADRARQPQRDLSRQRSQREQAQTRRQRSAAQVRQPRPRQVQPQQQQRRARVQQPRQQRPQQQAQPKRPTPRSPAGVQARGNGGRAQID